jgi:hypothetical protein
MIRRIVIDGETWCLPRSTECIWVRHSRDNRVCFYTDLEHLTIFNHGDRPASVTLGFAARNVKFEVPARHLRNLEVSYWVMSLEPIPYPLTDSMAGSSPPG